MPDLSFMTGNANRLLYLYRFPRFHVQYLHFGGKTAYLFFEAVTCLYQNGKCAVVFRDGDLRPDQFAGKGRFVGSHGEHPSDGKDCYVRLMEVTDDVFHVPHQGGISRVVYLEAVLEFHDITNSLSHKPGGPLKSRQLSPCRMKSLYHCYLDAVEISGGLGGENKNLNVRKGIQSEAKEGYFLPLAREARGRTELPILLVGGFRSRSVMEKVLADGLADYVSLCRPLISEPDLPNQFKLGLKEKSRCLSANNCWAEKAGVGISCKCPHDRLAEKLEG